MIKVLVETISKEIEVNFEEWSVEDLASKIKTAMDEDSKFITLHGKEKSSIVTKADIINIEVKGVASNNGN